MKHYIKITAFTLMTVICLVMVVATCVEKYEGTASFIYGSWWFASLWVLLAIASLAHIGYRKLHHRPVVFLLHVAFVTILLGALVTHIWGKQGVVHLREALPESMYTLNDNHRDMLPFALTLEDFEVQYYQDMKQTKDFVSQVSVDGKMMTISMNHIGKVGGYRFYQSSYDSDLHGTVLSVCYDPWGIGITYVGYGLLFLSMLLILLLPNEVFQATLRQLSPVQQQKSRKILYGFLSFLLLAVFSYVLYRWCMRAYSDGYLPPVLRSPLLTVHVGIIMVSYVLLIILFFVGLVGIVLKDNDKTMRLQVVGRALLYPALFFLAAGIFIGAIWANISWGRYWGWDPKEVWALITMLVYSLVMHRFSLPFFQRPKVFHTFMVIAFLTVLMTYFGVNFLLGGMHSYANG